MDNDLNPEMEAVSPADPGIIIQLDDFEGPLDLLLHLIRREEMEIWDIPIARVTEQYLEYLQIMKDLNINVAAEWLVMAVTLIYIKSRMLLPSDPESATEEEKREDPRAELVYQLLEHQKFKNAAQMLHTKEEIENAVWNNPPQELLKEAKGMIDVTLFDLLSAFHDVVRRFDERKHMEVSRDEVTLEEKLSEIRGLLLVHDKMLFSRFFQTTTSRQHLIIIFLALLELMRLREIRLYQRKTFGEIYIKRMREMSAEEHGNTRT